METGERAAGSISRAPPGDAGRLSGITDPADGAIMALTNSARSPPAPSRASCEPSRRRKVDPTRAAAEVPHGRGTLGGGATAQGGLGAGATAGRSAEGNGREPAGATTPPTGTVEGQQRSPQVTWLPTRDPRPGLPASPSDQPPPHGRRACSSSVVSRSSGYGGVICPGRLAGRPMGPNVHMPDPQAEQRNLPHTSGNGVSAA